MRGSFWSSDATVSIRKMGERVRVTSVNLLFSVLEKNIYSNDVHYRLSL